MYVIRSYRSPLAVQLPLFNQLILAVVDSVQCAEVHLIPMYEHFVSSDDHAIIQPVSQHFMYQEDLTKWDGGA